MSHTRIIASLAALALAFPVLGQPFATRNVTLHKHIPLAGFAGTPASGNDCWGYVSPSGREYALMGLSNSLAFVEITDPPNPVIVAQITHANSLWGSAKVHQHYAYMSNESGGGVQVIDMSGIDAGTVTLVRSVTQNGLSTSHTVAVDEVSGFLYMAGSNLGGLVAFSLANPSNPVYAGKWPGAYVHEAQIVTYTQGPYAGRQIAYCCCGEQGLFVVDVTNKSQMVTLAQRSYPGLAYCHQGWLSEDRRYFYIDDELDETNHYTYVTRTIIFDVQNPGSPFYAGWFTSGMPAVDHNLYVKGRFIYEANYTSGLRIFDARNPLAPIQVGWIDTYIRREAAPSFNGAWSNYPYFPSGTVIVSDIQGGLFIVDPSAAEHCMDGDFNQDGFIDGIDADSFSNAFESGLESADFNADGFVDGIDYDGFMNAFERGCP